MQEEALLAWFTHEHGVLVCAPTGTGKTLIAQAALFEALHTNTVPFVHGGRSVPVPLIGIELSLGVIVGVLVITTVASLLRTRLRGGAPA